MNNERLNKQIDFLKEIDQLKSIYRKTHLINKSRRENSAEHSWHISLYALILQEHSNDDINLLRVIKMLLIHDIVEIDAGDHPIYDDFDPKDQEKKEKQALERIFSILPKDQAKEYKELWLEFESVTTKDAIFAKSLDRIQPLIHNIYTDGGTWEEYNLTQKDVENKSATIVNNGSHVLWDYMNNKITNHFNN